MSLVELKHSVMSNSLQPHGLYSPWHSPGQNTGVGNLSLLLGIFPTQGLNPGLPHFRWILYQLSHKDIPQNKDIQLFTKSFEYICDVLLFAEKRGGGMSKESLGPEYGNREVVCLGVGVT